MSVKPWGALSGCVSVCVFGSVQVLHILLQVTQISYVLM